MKVDLQLKVDENYLIIHTLKQKKFSDENYKKDIVAFQDAAWFLSKAVYRILAGKFGSPHDYQSKNFLEITNYLEELKSTDEFKAINKQTQEYMDKCQKDWDKNYPETSEYIGKVIGEKLDGESFTGYLTHPGLCNGRHFGNNEFAFGRKEDWPNYSTVYFWHEMLHSIFGKSDLDHALIELITDEEMRALLNDVEYPAYVGHEYLKETKDQIIDNGRCFLIQHNGMMCLSFEST